MAFHHVTRTAFYRNLKKQVCAVDPSAWKGIADNLKKVYDTDTNYYSWGFKREITLSEAFIWGTTEQGFNYWDRINDLYCGGFKL